MFLKGSTMQCHGKKNGPLQNWTPLKLDTSCELVLHGSVAFLKVQMLRDSMPWNSLFRDI